MHPSLIEAALAKDAMAIYSGLETRVEAGAATEADRSYAHKTITTWVERTPEYNFARAAIAGRVAEVRGLKGKRFIQEAERFARKSVELDPEFRRGAAKRLLGTLYVLVPARFVMHGDSETGLEFLEDLVADYPDDLENHLRLAEAYVALGDPEAAVEPLCRCVVGESSLRRDDRQLLGRLVEDAGGPEALACAG